MEPKKCSKCRRRESVFHRYLSREDLCLRCLTDRVRRVVKKNLSLGGGVKPGCTVAIPINPLGIIDSIVAFKIVSGIESAYKSKTIAISPAQFIDHELSQAISKVLGSNEFYVIEADEVYPKNLLETHHYLMGLYARASKELGAGVLVNPLCFEKNSAMPISSFLHARPEGLGNSTLAVNADGVSIVSVFRGVSCQEITFIAYKLYEIWSYSVIIENAYNLIVNLTDDIDNAALTIVMDLIAEKNTESLYTLYKNEDILKNYYGARRCKWCYGYSIDGEYCYWCRRVLGGREPRIRVERRA